MNNEENQKEPSLCKMNCGFYGNFKTNGLCSSCYQKELKKNNSSILDSTNNNNNSSSSSNNITATSQPIEINPNNNNSDDSPSKSKKRSYESYFDITSSPSKFTPPKNINPSSPSKQLKHEENNNTTVPNTNNNNTTSTTTTTTTTTTTAIPIPTITNTKELDNSTGISPSSSPSIKDLSSSPSKEAFKCKYPGCGKSIGSIMASMSNKCRCGEFFCGKHIHNHNCTFDYKSLAKSNIAKANPQILANKIVKL